MLENVGKAFQGKTAYRRQSMELQEVETDWRSKPPAYKFYPYAPVISLPQPPSGPEAAEGPSLWSCIARRRSIHSFAASPITVEQLSTLLWASAGTTLSFITPHGHEFYRAAPSAGALYPIETYVIANRVHGLEPGLYHYRVAGLDILERPIVEGSHALEQLRAGDLSAEIKAAALDQPMCAKAAAVFLWSAIFERSTWKYGERGYRYIYLDAGHIAAHVALGAVALGLGSCPIAAFYDEEVNALLEIDGDNEAALYLAAVGNPARPFGERGRVDLRHTSRPKE